MTRRRARAAWAGAGVLFLAVVGVPAWVVLSREPRYEGDPAVIAQNERTAARLVAAAAALPPGPEREEGGYRLRSDGAFAYAWPAQHGVTGILTFVSDAEGRVAWTNDARYSGPGRGPPRGAALAPGASSLARVQRGEDGNSWRMLHE